ncbi:MAG: HD domain-containing phosphohydrolase [Sumerlaeia bacterium]
MLESRYLEVHGGPADGVSIPLDFEVLIIGRDLNSGLTLDDPKVSRRHSQFEVHNGSLYIRDLGSTNGTYLNARLIEYEKVQPDDVISIGASEISFRDGVDSHTINFTAIESIVTSEVLTNSELANDALAEQFANIFNFYKDYVPEQSEVEKVELVKTQRLLNGLESLFGVTTEMARLLPMNELLKVVAKGLFKVFAGAENLVILLYNPEIDRFVPAYARDREGDESPKVTVSTTILQRAIEKRSTLVGNDLEGDSSLNVSESIVNFNVKAAICAPLIASNRILGALYLDNRLKNIHYDKMDAELVTSFANQAAIAIDNARLCDTLQSSYVQTLQSLVKAIEAKDDYTRGHSNRVKVTAVAIAETLRVDQQTIDRLAIAAELHDIGKIGVSEGIINKPGNLTIAEYEDIKNHVILGIKILEPIQHLADVIPMIRGHHERWDGKGYPDGLKGKDIPYCGRILAVADTFDALTSKRAYNKPMNKLDAAQKILGESNTAFDPEIARALNTWVTSESSSISEIDQDPSTVH